MLYVFKKEIYRVFSDFKLFFTTFLLSPIIMIVIFCITLFIGYTMHSKVEERVSSVLLNNAPEFMQNVEGFDVAYREGMSSDEIAKLIKDGEYDVAFDFDEDFDAVVAAGGTPVIEYYVDTTNDYKTVSYNKVRDNYLWPYKDKVMADRVGGAEKLKIFTLNDCSVEYEIVEEKKASGRIFGSIGPYFIYITILAGAMGLVTESIAGEKERGTLATQLLTPLSREKFALGKLFGLSVHVATSTIISVLVFFLVVLIVTLVLPAGIINIQIMYTWKELLLMLAVLIPALIMNTSVFMLLSALARNLKEASGYIMPFYMAGIIMAMIPMQMPAGESFSWWMYVVPVLGQVCALSDVFTFSIRVPYLLLSIIIPIVIAIVMVFVIRIIFNKERFIVTRN